MDIRNIMLKYENNLSKIATKDNDAIRLSNLDKDIRPEYYRDIDKIIFSKSYMRYMDKTQVFTNKENDHISRRMSHVQMVSKIARTIGRALSLNEDLIEAISLGHDLGHVPFGHLGENFLNEISLKNNEGIFMHNVQGVRNLMFLENNGEGLNLTVQVLDGILCHNGELVFEKYHSKKKTKQEFINEYKNSYIDKKNIENLRPMTLEGCVVRISDVISYLGRDIEDAITLKIIKEDDIPKHLIKKLGKNNNEIIDKIVIDIIENSINKPYITMSKEINEAIKELMEFNYKNIYYKSITQEQKTKYKEMFETVFNENLKYLQEENKKTNIYEIYLNNMSTKYMNENRKERIVIDYISGMTDDYFIKEYDKIVDKRNN